MIQKLIKNAPMIQIELFVMLFIWFESKKYVIQTRSTKETKPQNCYLCLIRAKQQMIQIKPLLFDHGFLWFKPYKYKQILVFKNVFDSSPDICDSNHDFAKAILKYSLSWFKSCNLLTKSNLLYCDLIVLVEQVYNHFVYYIG